MAFAPATKKATISADITGNVLTVMFRDGREFVVDATKLSPEIQTQAMLHGMKQKLVDAAAIARSLDTGLPASAEDKYNAVKEVFDRVVLSKSPTWNKERGTGETKAGVNNVFIRALMQMTGKDRTFVDQFLENKSKEERAALKKNGRVLAIMAEIQAASAPADLDTDNLLAELGAVNTVSELIGEPDDSDVTHGAEPVDAVAVEERTNVLGKPMPKTSKARGKKAAVAAE